MHELQFGDTDTYTNFLLIDSSTFEELMSVVGPQITFHDSHLWKAILAEEMSCFKFSAVHVAAIVLCMHV